MEEVLHTRLKPLGWVKQLRLEAFFNVDYQSVITLSNKILANRDSGLYPADELTETQKRHLVQCAVKEPLQPLGLAPDTERHSLPLAFSALETAIGTLQGIGTDSYDVLLKTCVLLKLHQAHANHDTRAAAVQKSTKEP